MLIFDDDAIIAKREAAYKMHEEKRKAFREDLAEERRVKAGLRRVLGVKHPEFGKKGGKNKDRSGGA